jgi:hypothetical protein
MQDGQLRVLEQVHAVVVTDRWRAVAAEDVQDADGVGLGRRGYTKGRDCREEVMTVPRYLLVLDRDLLALDEQLDLEPINYLVGRQEQGQCEIVVLSLAESDQVRPSSAESLLGLRVGVYPTILHRPDHDVTAAAEHRMNLTLRHLNAIGCKASGIISDQNLVAAVRDEARAQHYDQVILATGHRDGGWLARALGPNLIRRLRRKWGDRLVIFQSES